MRPPTCGVTVTDSKAAFLPISSRYLGTSCAVAFTTVTNGAGVAGAAAWTPLLLHAVAVNKASHTAASDRCLVRKIALFFDVVFIPVLILETVVAMPKRPGGEAHLAAVVVRS